MKPRNHHAALVCTPYRLDADRPPTEKWTGVTHAVFRVDQLRPPTLAATGVPTVHDLAVLNYRSESFDLAQVLTLLDEKDLLRPVLFVGSRGGVLTILVEALSLEARTKNALDEYTAQARAAFQAVKRFWAVDVGVFDSLKPEESSLQTLVDAPDEEVIPYLVEIQQTWSLGRKRAPRQAFLPKHQIFKTVQD